MAFPPPSVFLCEVSLNFTMPPSPPPPPPPRRRCYVISSLDRRILRFAVSVVVMTFNSTGEIREKGGERADCKLRYVFARCLRWATDAVSTILERFARDVIWENGHLDISVTAL